MADGFVILNPGVGGEVMDEERVGPYPISPTYRLRSRVVVSGTSVTSIAKVIDTTPAQDDCGLVVRPIYDQNTIVPIGLPGTAVIETGTSLAVPALIDTTVVSFVVPVAQTFSIVGFVGSANVNSEYFLKVNGTTKIVARSTSSNLTIDISFKLAHPLATAGQTVALVVNHTSAVAGDFSGTILGYLIS